jgi:asparagine synthase (glutamine-hydrolysing)
MIEFIIEIPLNNIKTDTSIQFKEKPELKYYFSNELIEFTLWGDPILPNTFNKLLNFNLSVNNIIENICGHYYFVFLNKRQNVINIGNSLFSILPIYYVKIKDKLILSENALHIGKYLNNPSISKSFMLEMVLFNYPIFNNSIIEGVQLLPSNSYISIDNGRIKIEKHTHIENLFPSSPKPWKKSIHGIRDIFLENILKYLPDEPNYISLTGGFDGRTLVSASLYHNREFSCYSFGGPTTKDITIASELSKIAHIPFFKINIEDDYVKSYSLKCGLNFMLNASGTATFARAHYLFASKLLSDKTNCIITGNFGSEILRAAHNPGEVFSHNLFHLFNLSSKASLITTIEKSEEFKFLNREFFRSEWQEIKDKFDYLPCYNKDYSMLTQNQKFYVFVFEEVFRKYFGAEMVNQFKYLRNRTPFLDLVFLKAIFNTELSGIHSKFFEHNPLKRYKGQVLYANIINKAFPPFGSINTDKGYKPDDLRNLKGKFNILIEYIRKRSTPKNQANIDPYYVDRSWAINRKFFYKIPMDPLLYKNPANPSKELIYKCYSLSYLKSQIEI